MSWVVVLVGCAGCYLLKLVGTLVPARLLSAARVQSFARVLPVALLSGLVVVLTFDGGRRVTLDARIPGMMAAAIAIRLRAPFLAVVVIASVTSALVRLL